MSQQTVAINGILYDTLTGLPVIASTVTAPVAPIAVKKPHVQAKPSHAIHQVAQKSQTLNRRIVQKAPAHKVLNQKRQVSARPDIIRGGDIKKFAPHPAGVAPAVAAPKIMDMAVRQAPVQQHPIVARAHAQAAAKQQAVATAVKPSQVLKNEAIEEAISKAPARADSKQVKTSRKPKKSSRHLSIASASLAVLMLGGYFTYLNMPTLSVRVAAAQAGIDASYPTYRPSGYRLDGPVAFTDGEVSMKFASNAGPQSYNISQKKMNWDSTAVEQDVNQKTSGNYSTSTTSGLTIYLYGNNASWVNAGILYTLSGDAPLSSEQIDHIATSM